MGWERLQENAPEWVQEKAGMAWLKHGGVMQNRTQILRGDTYVYKIDYGAPGGKGTHHIYRQLKSNYHDTDRNEGTCPNCQAYVRRLGRDFFLTCHRCGWQYKPLTERLRHLVARLTGRVD